MSNFNYGTKEYLQEKVKKAQLEFDLLNEAVTMRIRMKNYHDFTIDEILTFAEPYKEILESAKNSIKYVKEELAKLEGKDNEVTRSESN